MLLSFWLACTPADDEVEATCGLEPEVIPDFTLEDMNPTSATYGEQVARDDHLGDVWFLYWAHAT